MNLSELVARYGDENVNFQILDECVTQFNKTKHGTRATFVTPEVFGLNGFDKYALVLWFDRTKLSNILALTKDTDNAR